MLSHRLIVANTTDGLGIKIGEILASEEGVM